MSLWWLLRPCSARSARALLSPRPMTPAPLTANGLGRSICGAHIVILSGSQVMIEGLPWLGETASVSVIGQIVTLDFKRNQFTHDLMPADVLGTHILQKTSSGKRELAFQPGAVFTNILLAD